MYAEGFNSRKNNFFSDNKNILSDNLENIFLIKVNKFLIRSNLEVITRINSKTISIDQILEKVRAIFTVNRKTSDKNLIKILISTFSLCKVDTNTQKLQVVRHLTLFVQMSLIKGIYNV